MLSFKSINAEGGVSKIAAYYEGYQLGKENPNEKETNRQHDEPMGKWVGSYAETRICESNSPPWGNAARPTGF